VKIKKISHWKIGKYEKFPAQKKEKLISNGKSTNFCILERIFF
jgi:hypothetical protein